MTAKLKRRKSSGPPLLSDAAPDHSWPIDRLSDYAKREYAEILAGERTQAPAYWRLGNALSLARKSFQHGQWEMHLKTIEIDKTRSAKACAIFKSFPTAEAVADLTIEQAYAARPSKSHRNRGEPTPADRSVRFGKALAKIEQSAAATMDGVKELTRGEKQELLFILRQTMKSLEAQLRRLESELTDDEPVDQQAAA